jgi:threonine dehydrogenase-like Zn-dependent dehydrogenase
VDKVGEDVRGVRIGERVSPDEDIRCGECRWCLSGRSNLCVKITGLGRAVMDASYNGGYAEYVRVPAVNLHRIPNNIPFEQACVAQTLGVSYHAVVDRGNIQPGEFAVVLGAGPIGLSALAAAKAFDAKVLITDVVPYRLEVAKKMGADFVVDTSKEDLVKRVMDLTAGEGADKVFECVGGHAHDVTLKQAMEVVRTAGRIVVVGMVSTPPYKQIDLGKMYRWEVELVSSRGSNTRIGATLELMGKGKIDVSPMITHIIPLEDVKRGLELMDKKTENVVKVVLKP